jgi:pimeloyl-ACP methyl ester carboxylesterase
MMFSPKIFLVSLIIPLLSCQSITGLHLALPDPVQTNLSKAHTAWQTLQTNPASPQDFKKSLQGYNQAVLALVKSLRSTDGKWGWEKDLAPATGATTITLEQSPNTVPTHTWSLQPFNQCRVASEVKLEGFDRVIARPGIGVPVVLVQNDSSQISCPFHPPRGEFLPATAVLEFSKHGSATLRFYNPLQMTGIPIGSHWQPLAENLTASLQLSITDSIVSEPARNAQARSASGEQESQLFFLHRYDPAKIPVVFVHGLRSGPVVWKNSINELLADPELRHRYQPLCFIYPSQLAIPNSSARLRQLLKSSRDSLDPKRQNPGFGRIVLVGHSMGGLLARMQAIDSGPDFWKSLFAVSQRTLANQTDQKTQLMVNQALHFKRMQNVKLLVFVCTPHQGSELADIGLLRSVAKVLLYLPNAARQRLKALTALPPAFINPALRTFTDFGLNGPENLATKHPFFRALAGHKLGVPFHSIIATRDAEDYHTSSDGVVPYWSSHLDGAASETLVPYTHGCLEKSGSVQAIMSILKASR